MNEPAVQALVDHQTMRERVDTGWYPEWVGAHFTTFTEALTGTRAGTPFPCHFGQRSIREGHPLYTAVPSLTDATVLLRFRDAMLEYLDTYQDRPGLVSLIAFFRPPASEWSEQQYHEALWHLLQFLHVHDPAPWPAGIPTDPDDSKWEFCFGGEPMFPTCRAPFYTDRPSRYCPIGLEITFQPRTLFAGITHDTPAGAAARDQIQGRIVAYDGHHPHPDLGDWGVPGDREWKQYLFREDPAEAPERCPISISREHPKARPVTEMLVADD